MTNQKHANSNLTHHNRQLWAGISALGFLVFLAFLYFKILPELTGEALQLEHRRLQNILASVRTQWQMHGEPEYMDLDWIENDHVPNTLVKMSPSGFPVPDDLTDQGCEQLWYKLLGVKLDSWEITGTYQKNTHSCHFAAVNLVKVIYELRSGNVNFLTN